MQSITFLSRRAFALTTALTMATLAACSDSAPVDVAPVLPGNPAIPTQYRGAAFIMDVNTLRKTVRISAPTSGIASRTSAASLNLGLNDGPQKSLLGGDVVDLTASNFVAGAVGAAVPGKVLITFDLTVNNKLAGIQLITPTFPTPPAGVTGVQAFPFEISVTTTSGGVGTSGNEIIVTSPRFGAVVPSSDWNGEPHNFFNDVGCTATANDCFRYEGFSTVAPLGASASQRVGFLIDPTVGDFRVKLILAADLEATTTPTPGTVSGTVTSPQLGNLNNVSVSVSGGFSGTTAASGAYSIANVATGSRIVSVSNLPSGCVAPASQNVTIPAGGTATANFSVTCTVPTGTIGGTITSSLGGGLSGVSVVATPTGGAATAAVLSNATGVYSITNVPALSATGTLTLANLPANCTNPGAINYTGFSTTGLTQNIVVTCTPAAVTYPYTTSWGPITTTAGGQRQVELTLAINMGAQQLASLSFGFAYNGTVLDYQTRAGADPDGLESVSVNEIGQGTAGASIAGAAFSINGTFATGNATLVRLRFNIAAGFSGTVTPTATISEALAVAGLANITSSVVIVPTPALVVP